MDCTIRKFQIKDVSDKVKWINNPDNNRFLHYDLPLKIDKTEEWFLRNQGNENRFDGIIEVEGESAGLIGLLNIDYEKKSAEYYITLGEKKFRGQGIANKSSKQLLEYGFNTLGLEKIYLYTEKANTAMQKLAKKISMVEEALLLENSMRNNQLYNSYYYSVSKEDFNNNIIYPEKPYTPIQYLDKDNGNHIFIKRDDLLPFSFGGNKARKAKYFFDDIAQKNSTVVVTYGSKASNHCRVIANQCYKNGLQCIIISPISSGEENYNRKIIQQLNAHIIECEVAQVSSTIDKTILKLKENGEKPYFIPGGGHGNKGTQAYVDTYNEIKYWERQENKKNDYIFLASGTGTTQAGLLIGQSLHKDFEKRIIGISVAREKDYGSKVIFESIKEYINDNNVANINGINSYLHFEDGYTGTTKYGESNWHIDNLTNELFNKYGIATSSTYTAKAYYGMKNYLKENNVKNKNILFIHTGGVPLFFNDYGKINNTD